MSRQKYSQLGQTTSSSSMLAGSGHGGGGNVCESTYAFHRGVQLAIHSSHGICFLYIYCLLHIFRTVFAHVCKHLTSIFTIKCNLIYLMLSDKMFTSHLCVSSAVRHLQRFMLEQFLTCGL
jgi:hypothetical protein